MVCVDLSNVESFYANAGKKKLGKGREARAKRQQHNA